MSKISCHIIQDILPLYVDGIVSEDTKEMVEEHLRECEGCRKEAEHMQERIVLPNKKEFYQKEQEMLQKFKRRLINRRVLSAILGAVFVCALLASGYTILMIPKEAIPFDPDKMKVEIVGEDAYLSYQGDDLAGSFFAYPVKVRDGNREKEVARVYLEKNLWSAYIQPHLQGKQEEMIYLCKASDMDALYYGELDIEYGENIARVSRRDGIDLAVIKRWKRKTGRTCRLFCKFFPFFIQFFQFIVVGVFFQRKFLTFDRVRVYLFLCHQHHQFLHFVLPEQQFGPRSFSVHFCVSALLPAVLFVPAN